MAKFKIGDTAWYKDTGAGWIQVKIIRIIGNYYHIKKLDGSAGFGTAEYRLKTDVEYEEILKAMPASPSYLKPPPLH